MQLANKIVPGSLGLMDFAAGMVAWTLSFTCPIGTSFFFWKLLRIQTIDEVL